MVESDNKNLWQCMVGGEWGNNKYSLIVLAVTIAVVVAATVVFVYMCGKKHWEE